MISEKHTNYIMYISEKTHQLYSYVSLWSNPEGEDSTSQPQL